MLELHQASFVLWFLAMSVHVLSHLGETARLSTKDWTTPSPSPGCRIWFTAPPLGLSMAMGLLLRW